jgi:hypothetical protein
MSEQRIPVDEFWIAVIQLEYDKVRKYIAEGFDVNAWMSNVPLITWAQPAEDMTMLKILWEAGAHSTTPWLEQVFADFAAGGDGEKFKRKKVQVGTITLHRFNGDEVYALERAYLAIEHLTENSSEVSLEGESRTILKSLPDTELHDSWPSAQIYVVVPFRASESLVGKRVSLPVAWDEQIGNTRASIYCIDHEPLEDNEIEILERRDNQYRVRWTGRTIDVLYNDASKPDTRVEIEGWFTVSDGK